MIINILQSELLLLDVSFWTIKCDGYMLCVVFEGTLVPTRSSLAFLERLELKVWRIRARDKVATVVLYAMIVNYGDRISYCDNRRFAGHMLICGLLAFRWRQIGSYSKCRP